MNPKEKDELRDKPIVTEIYCDNGELSHWELINPETGEVLWSSFPEETIAMGRKIEAFEHPQPLDVWEAKALIGWCQDCKDENVQVQQWTDGKYICESCWHAKNIWGHKEAFEHPQSLKTAEEFYKTIDKNLTLSEIMTAFAQASITAKEKEWEEESRERKILDAAKWYEQGIIDAGGCIGDGVQTDFEDNYGDQF